MGHKPMQSCVFEKPDVNEILPIYVQAPPDAEDCASRLCVSSNDCGNKKVLKSHDLIQYICLNLLFTDCKLRSLETLTSTAQKPAT